MRKTFHIYVLREQSVPVLMCLAGACFVLITGQLLQLMRVLFASSCRLKDIVELILFAMPRLLSYAAPMAALLGVMLAFVRFNNDNELVAFRAAGIGFLGFLPSVLGLLILMTMLSFLSSIFILPETNHAFEMKLRSIGRASVPSLMEEGVFISRIPKLVFFFRSVDHANYTAKGVFIQDQRQPNEKVTIAAQSAKIDAPADSRAITFKLKNGTITRSSKDLKEAQAVSFKNYDFTLSFDEMFGRPRHGYRKRSEMTLAQIYDKVEKASSKAMFVWWSFELEQRIAFPTACLFLGLLGPPLGSIFRQKGRMTGITMGVAVFLIYYVLLSVSRTLGESYLIPPFFAVWIPNLLCFALALYLWTKMQRESSFFLALLWRSFTRLRWSDSSAREQHGAIAR